MSDIEFFRKCKKVLNLSDKQEETLAHLTIDEMLASAKSNAYWSGWNNIKGGPSFKTPLLKKHVPTYIIEKGEELDDGEIQILSEALTSKTIEEVLNVVKEKSQLTYAKILDGHLTPRNNVKSKDAKIEVAKRLLDVFGDHPLSNIELLKKREMKSSLSSIFYKIMCNETVDMLVKDKFRGNVTYDRRVDFETLEIFQKFLKSGIRVQPTQNFLSRVIIDKRVEELVDMIIDAKPVKSYASPLMTHIQDAEKSLQGHGNTEFGDDHVLLKIFTMNRTVGSHFGNKYNNKTIKVLKKL